MQPVSINVEFAHVDLALPLSSEESEWNIVQSGKIAQDLLSEAESRGLSCTTSILIDDKHSDTAPSSEEVGKLLSFVRLHGPRVDFLCIESSLVSYEYRLLTCMKDTQRRRIERELDSYRHRYGKLGCSQDIAIWHLLRLGYLGEPQARSVIPVGVTGQSRRPFFADEVVSVLPRGLAPFEEKAKSDLLDHCEDGEVENRIRLIFF